MSNNKKKNIYVHSEYKIKYFFFLHRASFPIIIQDFSKNAIWNEETNPN